MSGGYSVESRYPMSNRVTQRVENLGNKKVWLRKRREVYELLERGDVAINLYGGRQIGKTTLMLDIRGQETDRNLFIDLHGCYQRDEPFYRQLGRIAEFDVETEEELKILIGRRRPLLMFDEIEHMNEIGLGGEFTDFIEWLVNQEGIGVITASKKPIGRINRPLRSSFTCINLAK